MDGELLGPASSGRDCVAPGDGELRVSAASGRGCDAPRDGGRWGFDAAGRDCVAGADLVPRVCVGVLVASLPSGDVAGVAGTGNLLSQLQIAILTLVRHLPELSVVVHVLLVVHA